MGGPISGLLYNPALTKYIETQLEELGFQSSKSLLTDYFETFGLINETQHDSISNLESLLKIIDLFSKIGEFSNVDRSAIEKMANIIYFNNGNCGAQGIEKATQERISSAFAEYKEIYTTNYDMVLDERVPGKEIRHLHGGFLYDDKTHRSDMIVQPEKAVLIWGITGEEKQKKMTATFSFPVSYPMEYPISLFSKYLNDLESIDADSIDIFGYSGENDQHINRAISNNPNIKKVNYYCDPQEVGSERYEFKIKSLFGIDATKELQLVSWEKMWEVLKVDC